MEAPQAPVAAFDPLDSASGGLHLAAIPAPPGRREGVSPDRHATANHAAAVNGSRAVRMRQPPPTQRPPPAASTMAPSATPSAAAAGGMNARASAWSPLMAGAVAPAVAVVHPTGGSPFMAAPPVGSYYYPHVGYPPQAFFHQGGFVAAPLMWGAPPPAAAFTPHHFLPTPGQSVPPPSRQDVRGGRGVGRGGASFGQQQQQRPSPHHIDVEGPTMKTLPLHGGDKTATAAEPHHHHSQGMRHSPANHQVAPTVTPFSVRHPEDQADPATFVSFTVPAWTLPLPPGTLHTMLHQHATYIPFPISHEIHADTLCPAAVVVRRASTPAMVVVPSSDPTGTGSATAMGCGTIPLVDDATADAQTAPAQNWQDVPMMMSPLPALSLPTPATASMATPLFPDVIGAAFVEPPSRASALVHAAAAADAPLLTPETMGHPVASSVAVGREHKQRISESQQPSTSTTTTGLTSPTEVTEVAMVSSLPATLSKSLMSHGLTAGTPTPTGTGQERGGDSSPPLAAPLTLLSSSRLAALDRDTVRVFIGQLPYHVNELQLIWICAAFGGRISMPQRIMKTNERGERLPTGGVHVLCDRLSFHMLKQSMHKRVLVDDTGVWFAATMGQKAMLDSYVASLHQHRHLRVKGRPYETVVVQEAESTYVPHRQVRFDATRTTA